MGKLLRLFLAFAFAFTLVNCSDTSTGTENNTGTEETEPVPEQEAVDAVEEVIQNKGWTAPSSSASEAQTLKTVKGDPTILDYIATEANDSGAREVYMLIGPDGHLIPTSEWQSNNQGKCKQESLRYLKAADKRFNLEMHELADGYDVFAQYIDIETGEIEEQREGQSASLVDAVTAAWDKIDSPINKPAYPCGEKISNISLEFSSTTSHESIPKDAPDFSTTTDDQVEATVELTYDEQDSVYVGSGDLEWANFEYSSGDCDLPDPAQLEAHKFVYGDPTTSNGETELQIQFHDMNKTSCTSPDGSFEMYPDISFAWWLLHENEIHKEVDLDGFTATVEYIYALRNWESAQDNDAIIVQKQYDHSRRIESESFINKVSGESTLRILHESNQ